MGNSMSQRFNSSSSSGLGFYFSFSVNGLLFEKASTRFFKQKSISTLYRSSLMGLTAIIRDSVSSDSDSKSKSIVFPPLIALQILYSAPAELWNWEHPNLRGLSMANTIIPRDKIVIPTNLDDIIRSKEYTCVVSTKDGYPKMTHYYANIVIGCHPVYRTMVAAVRGGDNYRHSHHGVSLSDPLSEEFLHCCICKGNKKQMRDFYA